jgi:hypothetical protein
MAKFTTTIASFKEAEGNNIASNKPSVNLIIIPDDGYTISTSNFSVIQPLPNSLSGVTFLQDGKNIIATATFKNPTIMPSYDVNVPICIKGFAEQAMYSISGTITNQLCNTSSPVITSFSSTNNFGAVSVISEIPVYASNGYYFPTQPTLVLSKGDVSNYVFSSSNTLDDKGNIIGVDFVVVYTFPNANVSGDVLSLNACAQVIYNPAVKITGYSTPLNTVLSTGESRAATIYGVEGAAYSLTYKDAANVTINTFSGTIGANGTATLNIVYPPTINGDTYTFTLTGDLASTFNTPSGQPSVWTVSQMSATTTTTTTVPPGPVAQTMITFGVDNSSTACGNIIAGVEFALRTTRYSVNSFINPGDTIYNGPGLTNPMTFTLPLYYGYFVGNSVIAAWVYVGTDGVVISSGYCS